MKAEENEDLTVIGVFMGQAGTKNVNTIGGVIVDRNGVSVRVSGLTDEMRALIWERWQRDAVILGVTPDVGFAGAQYAEIVGKSDIGTFEVLGIVAEIEYHEVTRDGSLRHPRFVRWRHDKTGEVDK